MTILVTGPESSGKTTLAKALAEELNGTYVAEVAREYLLARGGNYSANDLPAIWAQQKAAEDASRGSSAAFIVCDTGPEVVRIWSEVKYGFCPKSVLVDSLEREYDLTLLCYPDLPWEADPLREAPDKADRLDLFERYQKLLPQAEIIKGKDRLSRALALVQR